MKWICSNEVNLQRKLLDLEPWLTDRGYKSEIIRPEIQNVTLIDRNNLLKKRPKHQFYPNLHVQLSVIQRHY